MMNSSNDNKPNENMDSSDEVLVLDQPCEYCKVLELDDSQHGGIVQQAEDGKRFVQFTNPVNRKPGMEYELSLGYRREDTLPGLPNIAATAQTCAFCHMLRSDLSFSYKNLQQSRVNGINGTEHEKEDENHAFQDAKMTITDVSYLFGNPLFSRAKTWDDDDDDDDATSGRLNHPVYDDWLNVLIVFIVIDWGNKKEEYSLQYRISADACGMLLLWLYKVLRVVALTRVRSMSTLA